MITNRLGTSASELRRDVSTTTLVAQAFASRPPQRAVTHAASDSGPELAQEDILYPPSILLLPHTTRRLPSPKESDTNSTCRGEEAQVLCTMFSLCDGMARSRNCVAKRWALNSSPAPAVSAPASRKVTTVVMVSKTFG